MIKIYKIDDCQWDTIVCSFIDYDVYYLSGYVKAFHKQGEGEPILFYYENGTDRAINVVFKRDIALDPHFIGKLEEGKYFDLISPYGYGGFLGAISDYQKLNQEYSDYCIENHFVCEFVRFGLFTDYHKYFQGEVESRTHNVVRRLDNMSIDEIWMDFKAKVRKNVKKAISYNVEIVIEDTGLYLNDFLRIYYGTMERTEANNSFFFHEDFFRTLMTMKGHYMFFHVLYENKVISTELVIKGVENCYSYLGGTDRDYFDVRPNDFLKYEIIKWAKEKGLKNFVLGGGYGADDGIFQYKQCLAPNGIVDFYIGRRVFNEELYEKLISMRQSEDSQFDKDSSFFPVYRS